jgi:ubiquinone/menaquinone biosynthesis C-methylase UbiE
MEKPMSTLDFKVMSFGFRIRDVFRPRIDILREVGIRPGSSVLDYGCGPGGYIPALAELVGPTGQIYALDLNPAAIAATQKLALRKKIENVRTILSDCSTGLSDPRMDAILLYDTFHHLSQPDDVLRELHRVLKDEGVLSFSDHHMEERDIVAGVTGSGMFELANKGRRTYSFVKADVG